MGDIGVGDGRSPCFHHSARLVQQVRGVCGQVRRGAPPEILHALQDSGRKHHSKAPQELLHGQGGLTPGFRLRAGFI